MLIPVFIFLIILETGSKYYLESNGHYRLGPMTGIHRSVRPWKNLPYHIRLSGGRIKRGFEDGKLFMDVPYQIDQGSRRVSYPEVSNAQDYLVFIGCSFTFGVGVLDHETLPSQFQKQTNDYRAYNYGVGGASPREIYYRLKNISKDELLEKKGRVVYSFFSGHLSRHFFLPDFVGRWGFQKPVYKEVDGKIENMGPYSNLHPYRTWFYKTRLKSYAYQVFKEVFPDKLDDNQLMEFADYVEKMSNEAIRLSGKKLIVIVWPGSNEPAKLYSYLAKENIDLINLSHMDLKKMTNGQDVVPYDGHPSAKTYAIIATQLLSELKKFK